MDLHGVVSGDGARQNVELQREAFFPTLIYFRDLPGAAALNADIIPHIYTWREADQDGIVRSNIKPLGSWHSRLDMHRRPEYRALAEEILAAAETIFADLGYDPAWAPAFDNMWANVNPRFGYNRSHIHPNTLWSGVYYIQAPEKAGRIFFTDPRPQALMYGARFKPEVQRKPEMWNEVYYQPIAGRMILFPSWLLHEVEPNMTDAQGCDADRISVSFNIHQERRAKSE